MSAWHRFSRYVLLGGIVLLCGAAYGYLRTAGFGEPESFADEAGAKGKHPRLVLIIRHGEKANDENDIHLNSRGAARAAALPALFVIPPHFPTKPASFATPDFLYAAKESKHSNRSVETLMPLAKALGDMPIDQKHANDKFQAVVDQVFGDDKHAGKNVLICWHQGNIPDLALAIAAKAKNSGKLKAQIPGNWSANVFDRVWLITFDEQGHATFADQPQRLLFGDVKK